MIRLKFSGFQDAHALTIGSEPGFRVAGNFLRALPGNSVVGEYMRHQWCVKGQHFSRYDVLDPCIVYFTDVDGAATRTFGPFQSLHTADGTMYADDQLFAKFIDETLLWHSFTLETWWPSLILTTPERPP